MTDKDTATEFKGVRAKLLANKAAKTGSYDFPLKDCGVTASVPNFINHGLWMRAQRIAKGDTSKAQAAFICEAVLFDGEKLTVTDLAELVPAGDTLALINEVFGEDEDEGKEKAA
ncbi:hypothetical protein GOZ89_16240 [Agrobacterium vitis]|uniref:hypothetical protein n=1 Tax=Agrobacterium vitis TaxID=373 RepID=UPI0012E890BB|nr:hypothetical protein [Agrobacterium vitis]MCF1454086.1 hypothetical protein [Agrobacterium vitis]MVA80976.1 hypothetical protein [Agrobacterium vitis]BCH55270.1 hypothetical protein RvVAR031_28800 [Agrobacterium vitis]